jgi:hypothetical protein
MTSNKRRCKFLLVVTLRPALVAHNGHNVISTPVQAVKDTSSVAANESVVQGLGLFNKIVATAVKGRQ